MLLKVFEALWFSCCEFTICFFVIILTSESSCIWLQCCWNIQIRSSEMSFPFLIFFALATLPEDWHSCYKALSGDSCSLICWYLHRYICLEYWFTAFEDSESHYASKIENNNCKSELHCNDQFPLTKIKLNLSTRVLIKQFPLKSSLTSDLHFINVFSVASS